MQDATTRADGLVRREDHRTLSTMALVDDLEEHIGRVCPVGEVADFIDNALPRDATFVAAWHSFCTKYSCSEIG